MIDARGIPTCICPQCGGNIFRALVSFDPKTYTINSYQFDVQCHGCGAFTTAPTPIDHPDGTNIENGEL